MKWPRGRYNDQRIIGLVFKFELDVTRWRWVPFYAPFCGGLHWLCVRTWTEWHYESLPLRRTTRLDRR